MKESKSFGYLGHTFQVKLINQIITDKKFANNIIEVIDPSISTINISSSLVK